MDNRKSNGFFYGIRRQAIISMTILISIVFVITYIVVSKVMSEKTYDSLSDQYTYINEKNQLSFHNLYEALNQLTNRFVVNKYVQQTLGDIPLGLKDRTLMEKSLSYLNKSYLDYYLIIDNKDNIYSSKTVSLDMDKFKKSELYRNLGNEYTKPKLLWARDTIFGSYDMKLFAICYIRKMNGEEKPGILILELNKDFFNPMKKDRKRKELVSMIVDKKQQLCYQESPPNFVLAAKMRNLVVKEAAGRSETWKNLSQGMIVSHYHNQTGFTIITYAPAKVTNQVIREIQLVFAVIFGIAYGVLFICIILFTKKLTNPIQQLSSMMEEFDDTKLQEVLNLNTNTELDCIGDAYNSMVQRVKQLMLHVQTKERELTKSELNRLLYQIRPHFLYNTLDTIYMLARIQKEETIMKMIQELSKYLRIHLSNGREEYEIHQELEQICSYMEIQKIRNAELFEYKIQCEEELEKYKIIKIILQPIVENCIKHGFKDIYEGGKIGVKVFSETGYVVICIENNGLPIEEEKLKRLNKLEKIEIDQIDLTIQKKEGGFGICNVVKRLRIRYHEHIRFYYKNKENGTECFLKIAVSELMFNN